MGVLFLINPSSLKFVFLSSLLVFCLRSNCCCGTVKVEMYATVKLPLFLQSLSQELKGREYAEDDWTLIMPIAGGGNFKNSEQFRF